MRIEIWSDFLCPYCLLGKKRLEVALSNLGIQDAEIEVMSYLLHGKEDKLEGRSILQYVTDKSSAEQARQSTTYLTQAGLELGLKMDFDRAVYADTTAAHLVFQQAKQKGMGTAFSDRLQTAVFCEGAYLGEHETLLRLSLEAGLSQEEFNQALTQDDLREKAQAEYDRGLAYGIKGVPFFVFNDRFAVSGAQPIELFEKALTKTRKAEEEEG